MTIYYVDGINGSNSNNGLSQGNAFLTIDYALSVAVDESQIIVRGNTSYTVNNPSVPQGVSIIGVASDWTNDGTRVTLSNAPASASFFTLTGSFVTLANLNTGTIASGTSEWIDSSGGNYSPRCVNIDFDGQEIMSRAFTANSGGISAMFVGCRFRRFTFNAVHDGASANRNGPSYYNCFFDDTTPMDGGTKTSIFVNCVMFGPNSNVFGTLYHEGPIIINCVFYEATLTVSDRSSSSLKATVVNSVFMSNAGEAIRVNQTTREAMGVFSNNIFFNNTGGNLDTKIEFSGTNNETIDPKFTDPVNGDFTFDSNSPLVGRGFDFLNQNIGPTRVTPTASSSGGGTRMSFS